MSTMGDQNFFVGLQLEQKKGGMLIYQEKYVTKVVKKFKIRKFKIIETLEK